MTIRSRSLPRPRPTTRARRDAVARTVLVTSMALAIALGGCRKPQAPDPEVPPEPQAGTAATTSPSTATAAMDAADIGHSPAAAAEAIESQAAGGDAGDGDGYQTPLERVRDVETKVGDAAERTRATIDPP